MTSHDFWWFPGNLVPCYTLPLFECSSLQMSTGLSVPMKSVLWLPRLAVVGPVWCDPSGTIPAGTCWCRSGNSALQLAVRNRHRDSNKWLVKRPVGFQTGEDQLGWNINAYILFQNETSSLSLFLCDFHIYPTVSSIWNCEGVSRC